MLSSQSLNFTFAGMVFGNTVKKFTFLDDAYIAYVHMHSGSLSLFYSKCTLG